MNCPFKFLYCYYIKYTDIWILSPSNFILNVFYEITVIAIYQMLMMSAFGFIDLLTLFEFYLQAHVRYL